MSATTDGPDATATVTEAGAGFVVERIDGVALLAHLRRHGAARRSEVQMNHGAGGQGPSLYLDDTDGNVVKLKGPATVVTEDPR